jgi:hypothetical protein
VSEDSVHEDAGYPGEQIRVVGGRRSVLREKAFGLGVMTAAIVVLAFSLADRKADRYVFPM